VSPATFAALMNVMPIEPGQTVQQREEACAMATRRLRIKNQIRQIENGWAIA
jgi:hypothetical protein